MDIEKKDIIVLSDQKNYVVVSKINYEQNFYYYIVDIDDVANLKFVQEVGEELIELRDKELVTKLIPLFTQDAMADRA